jgi:signal transduction histidine kinase
MISKIFAKSVESVVDNLRLISNSPSVKNGDSSGIDLLGLAERNTGNLTDFYIWLDGEGKMVGSSSAIDGTNEKLAKDLSNTPFFSVPKTTLNHYVSNLSFFEGIPRMFISVPILDANTRSQTNASAETNGNDYMTTNVSTYAAGTFEGVIAAAIRVDELGGYLQNQIPNEYNGFVGVVNSNGIMLSSANLSHIGKSIFGIDINPILPAKAKHSFNLYLNQSLFVKKPTVQNITYDNRRISIGIQPLVFGQPVGDQFATLFVSSSHPEADEIGSLMRQQASFGVSVYMTILFLATGLAFVIILWNKKLRELVDKKTKEIQKSNQRLQIANEQLKINDKTQKDFVNIAAHELRTPIQAIMGNAEMAMSEPQYKEFDDKNGQFINAINRNASRLHKLTEYLLDVAKIESGTLKIKKEKCNINERIKHVLDGFGSKQEAEEGIDSFSYKMSSKNIELTFVKPTTNPIVGEVDIVRFEQAISNLIDNAIKFIDKDAGKVKISVDAVVVEYAKDKHKDIKDKKKLTISVKDNGRGIHPDISHNLFHKFTSNAEFGTGLGLFICKNIIEAHGGRIWAENNKDGKGATFSFSLPLEG